MKLWERTLGVRGSSRLRLFFGRKLLHFFHESVDDLRFRHFADHLALLEDQADALATRHPEIRGPRFSRAVDLTTHYRHVDVQVAIGHHSLLDFFCQTDKIDVSAPARGASNEGQSFLSDAEGFQDFSADPHFLYGICGQRHPDRVADSFGQQGSETDG